MGGELVDEAMCRRGIAFLQAAQEEHQGQVANLRYIFGKGPSPMAKPSKGTPADKRLKANKSAAGKPSGSAGGSKATFGGKKATPFKRGGGRKK